MNNITKWDINRRLDQTLTQLVEGAGSGAVSDEDLFRQADSARRTVYGNAVYIRGLIELTNYCKNDCYYCGIRASNRKTARYRLDMSAILNCCETGYALGFRTFVLQGGEDPYFTDRIICEIVSAVKNNHPDCAVTLSLGEKSRASYQSYFNAGADRYLLRHESANPTHYAKLHPAGMSAVNRKQCLWDLKTIGYQVGAGFLVGSPYQTGAELAEDLRFLQDLRPEMIGIGPFLPHKDTPFAYFPPGDLRQCLRLIAILRLMFPCALIPATTALSVCAANGREQGLKAGANVLMPNLSPNDTRALYALYNGKNTGEDTAAALTQLKESVRAAGYEMVVDAGNAKTTCL